MRRTCIVILVALTAMLWLRCPAAHAADAEQAIAQDTPTPITVNTPSGTTEVNIIVYPPASTPSAPPKGTETPEYINQALAITQSAENSMSSTLTALSIIISVVAIGIAVLIARGFFNLRAIGEIYTLRDEFKDIVKDAKEQAERIKSLHDNLSSKAKEIASRELGAPLTDEDKAMLTQAASSLELLEVLGQKLTPEDYFSLAYDYGLKGKINKAIELYDKALKIKPDFPEAFSNKGNALGNLGRHDEAIAEFDKALKIKPDFPEALSNKGAALAELGKYEEAIAEFDKAFKIKLDYPKALSNKGAALANLDKYDEAIAEYDKALKIKSDFPDALYNKGSALNKLGRHDEAIAEFDKALKIKSDFPDALYNKGNALNKLGRRNEAIAEYDKAIKIKPNYTDAYFNRACAHALSDNRDEAISDLKRSIELDDKYKEMARKDEDFKSLHSDPEFRRLVGMDDMDDTDTSPAP